MGGDVFAGTNFVEAFQVLVDDPNTEGVMMIMVLQEIEVTEVSVEVVVVVVVVVAVAVEVEIEATREEGKKKRAGEVLRGGPPLLKMLSL